MKKGGKKRRTLTIKDRVAIAASQEWKCCACESTLDECFEIDHIEPFSESGNDHHSNLWALCPNCHAKKTEVDRRRYKPGIWHGCEAIKETDREAKRQYVLSKIFSPSG
jgi:5-methylcytosine-specific restriction endonuclease McrA